MRPEARQWLKIAMSDCELGRIAFKKGMYPQAIYLYCQAIEKALKASQIEFTRTVPKKIHYLDVLAKESGLPFAQFQIVLLKQLSSLYSRVRYPDIAQSRYNTRRKTQAIIKNAEDIFQWIIDQFKRN